MNLMGSSLAFMKAALVVTNPFFNKDVDSRVNNGGTNFASNVENKDPTVISRIAHRPFIFKEGNHFGILPRLWD